MIFNRDYFEKGEVAGGLVVRVKDYAGLVVDTRTFIGEPAGKYVLTLAWSGGRETKHFDTFAKALAMSGGYWARQAIWHETSEGKRKRVLRWQ
jgi:hypothetical protein